MQTKNYKPTTQQDQKYNACIIHDCLEQQSIQPRARRLPLGADVDELLNGRVEVTPVGLGGGLLHDTLSLQIWQGKTMQVYKRRHGI